MSTAQTLTERALQLEFAMYQQGIEPACPISLAGTTDRWQAERMALADARRAIDEGLDYFSVTGALHGAELRAGAAT